MAKYQKKSWGNTDPEKAVWGDSDEFGSSEIVSRSQNKYANRNPARENVNRKPDGVSASVWAHAQRWFEVGETTYRVSRLPVNLERFAIRLAEKVNSDEDITGQREGTHRITGTGYLRFGRDFVSDVIDYVIDIFWDHCLSEAVPLDSKIQFVLFDQENWDWFFHRAYHKVQIDRYRERQSRGLVDPVDILQNIKRIGEDREARRQQELRASEEAEERAQRYVSLPEGHPDRWTYTEAMQAEDRLAEQHELEARLRQREKFAKFRSEKQIRRRDDENSDGGK